MGPVFGIRAAARRRQAQIIPWRNNLHFNGDFHAVNVGAQSARRGPRRVALSRQPLRIDVKTITWPRTLDMNERQLRYVTTGLGGKSHGVPRDSQFIIRRRPK